MVKTVLNDTIPLLHAHSFAYPSCATPYSSRTASVSVSPASIVCVIHVRSTDPYSTLEISVFLHDADSMQGAVDSVIFTFSVSRDTLERQLLLFTS